MGRVIKIAVCDDYLDDRKRISEAIKKYFGDGQVLLEEFNNGEDLLNSNVRFDIILLDIQMPDLDGIETAQKLRNFDIHSKIIYITEFSGFKSKAFRVHAFDYIDKPVQEEDIYQSLADAIKILEQAFEEPDFCFKTESGFVTLKLKDIYYFEYLAKRVTIHSVRGNYVASYSLKELLQKFQKFNFASSHKSFLINMMHIKRIIKFDIYIENDDVIPLAQKRAVQFKKHFNDFLQSTFDQI